MPSVTRLGGPRAPLQLHPLARFRVSLVRHQHHRFICPRLFLSHFDSGAGPEYGRAGNAGRSRWVSAGVPCCGFVAPYVKGGRFYPNVLVGTRGHRLELCPANPPVLRRASCLQHWLGDQWRTSRRRHRKSGFPSDRILTLVRSARFSSLYRMASQMPAPT